jgi:uncharacterized NAD(P)/FAD-binding protein YdhS
VEFVYNGAMSRLQTRVPVVAVVGGGCAGTLVAAHLLRGHDGPLRIVVIERSGRFGPGVAYATEDPQHLLNVPAERMSAFREEPLHFALWAAERLGGIAPASYLPRGLYGEYLRAVLDDSGACARPQRTLELMSGEVLAVRRTRAGLELQMTHAAPLACDRIVLATGAPGVARMAQLPSDERVLDDPWTPSSLSARRSSGLTLVLGTGLSGVDATLSLCRGRHRVLALSRGGHFSHVHLPGLRAPAPPPIVPRAPVTLPELQRILREHVHTMQGCGYDWRDAIDGVRPVTAQLWGALALSQRRLFLRERRRDWDIRRHRMAPAVGARLRELLDSSQVQLQAGSLLAARSTAAGVEVDVAAGRSGRVRTLSCERVVVCTGAGMDVRRSGNPLLDMLLVDGVVSPDSLALGLRTTDEGAVIDSRGLAGGRLFTLGALRRGELWESTAVEEIRAQAERLASALQRSLETSASTPRSSPSGNGNGRHLVDAESRPGVAIADSTTAEVLR